MSKRQRLRVTVGILAALGAACTSLAEAAPRGLLTGLSAGLSVLCWLGAVYLAGRVR